jgi:sulfotransferase
MKKYHLITGLHRSGSTLLTAILNQNPKFDAGPSTGLYDLMYSVYDRLNSQNIYVPLINESKRKNILLGLFESYYKDVDKEVCFNTNRGWILFPHLISFLDPNIKFICCVREIPLIMNSFERLYQKHPTHIINMLRRNTDHKDFGLVENRCRILFDEYLLFGVKAVQEILISTYRNRFLFVEHESLCNNPRKKIQEVYDFIEEPYFDHDFSNVESSHKELDLFANCPTLHTTEKIVRASGNNLYISRKILDQYNIGKYWID